MRMTRRAAAVLGMSGMLAVSGCGGAPLYSEQAVETLSTPASPSSTTAPATSTTSSPPRATTAQPTRSPTATPTTTPTATPKKTVALDSLGGPGSGPISIAGTRYPNSFAISACTIYSEQPTYAFPLKGRYQRLSATVGQDDASESQQAVLRVTVKGDGRTLASKTVRFGQRAELAVAVSGVRTLTLVFTEISCGSGGAAFAVGNGQLS
ncbi:NPCBM/NEW2 domain-containing protein [Demetria terragena]|uniref:NPCBM/NEW2 domain-containing protein n=1 Tax=Demetria terragena TaxID=63959 RepID=UPI0012EA0BC0|nr:NPCBM/NEW2 domain-containing protein [Demetria terragena]